MILLLIAFFFVQCGKDVNDKHQVTGENGDIIDKPKPKPPTEDREASETLFYKSATQDLGKEIHQFKYMYPLNENEIKYFPEYVKVSYNKKKQILDSEHFQFQKPSVSFKYYYSNNRLIKVEFTVHKKINPAHDVLEYQYKDDKEKEMIHYDKERKVKGKRLSFYENNLLVRRETFEGDKKLFESKFEYDNNANLIKESIINDSKVATAYHYQNNRIIKKEIFKENKAVAEKKFEYDPKGNTIKEENTRRGKLVDSYHYKYNDDGAKIKIEYYKKGTPFGKWTSFNNKGKPVIVQSFKRGKHSSSIRFYYNKMYQLIKEEVWKKDSLNVYYSYSYNKFGLPLKCLVYNGKKEQVGEEDYIYKNGKELILRKVTTEGTNGQETFEYVYQNGKQILRRLKRMGRNGMETIEYILENGKWVPKDG